MPRATQTQPVVRAERARQLTRWSWLMLPALIGSFGLASLVGHTAMAALGVRDGGLLAEAGVRGWLAFFALLVIEISPLVCGCVLARLALRTGAGRSAVGAMVANGVLAAYLVLTQLVQMWVG